jgi:hypothetical protein
LVLKSGILEEKGDRAHCSGAEWNQTGVCGKFKFIPGDSWMEMSTEPLIGLSSIFTRRQGIFGLIPNTDSHAVAFPEEE